MCFYVVCTITSQYHCSIICSDSCSPQKWLVTSYGVRKKFFLIVGGVSLAGCHCLSFHVNSFSLTSIQIFLVPFMSFSCCFHVLVISFSSFHVIQGGRNPRSKTYFCILAKPSIEEVFRSISSQLGKGVHKSLKKWVAKGYQIKLFILGKGGYLCLLSLLIL